MKIKSFFTQSIFLCTALSAAVASAQNTHNRPVLQAFESISCPESFTPEKVDSKEQVLIQEFFFKNLPNDFKKTFSVSANTLATGNTYTFLSGSIHLKEKSKVSSMTCNYQGSDETAHSVTIDVPSQTYYVSGHEPYISTVPTSDEKTLSCQVVGTESMPACDIHPGFILVNNQVTHTKKHVSAAEEKGQVTINMSQKESVANSVSYSPKPYAFSDFPMNLNTFSLSVQGREENDITYSCQPEVFTKDRTSVAKLIAARGAAAVITVTGEVDYDGRVLSPSCTIQCSKDAEKNCWAPATGTVSQTSRKLVTRYYQTSEQVSVQKERTISESACSSDSWSQWAYDKLWGPVTNLGVIAKVLTDCTPTKSTKMEEELQTVYKTQSEEKEMDVTSQTNVPRSIDTSKIEEKLFELTYRTSFLADHMVLDISKNADIKTVESAYRQFALMSQPDKCALGTQTTDEKHIHCNNAFQRAGKAKEKMIRKLSHDESEVDEYGDPVPFRDEF